MTVILQEGCLSVEVQQADIQEQQLCLIRPGITVTLLRDLKGSHMDTPYLTSFSPSGTQEYRMSNSAAGLLQDTNGALLSHTEGDGDVTFDLGIVCLWFPHQQCCCFPVERVCGVRVQEQLREECLEDI